MRRFSNYLARLAAAAVFISIFFTGLVGVSSRAQAQYLSAAPDVPLARFLRELPDGVLIFDKPQGRIVQVTTAITAKTQPTATVTIAADIEKFYRASLPNLGWQLADNKAGSEGRLTFTRKGEILRLTISADVVIFDLAPCAAK